MSRRKCDRGSRDPIRDMLTRIDTQALSLAGSYIGSRKRLTVKTPFMPDKIIIRTGGG